MPRNEDEVRAPGLLRVRCLDPLDRRCAAIVLVPWPALAGGPVALAQSCERAGWVLAVGQWGRPGATAPEGTCLDLVCADCFAAARAAEPGRAEAPPDIADLVRRRPS